MKSQRWMLGLAMACMGLLSGPTIPQALAGPSHGTNEGSIRVAQYNQYGRRDDQRDQRRMRWRRGNFNRQLMVPQGTTVNVTVNSDISTASASVGDRWTGTVERDVVVDGRVAVPAGTPVYGTVTESQPGRTGRQNATLGLAMTSIDQNGRQYSMHGSTEPIVAGTGRAHQLGFIAGGAAAGAIIGNQVSHGKGTVIGGLLGGLLGGAYGHSRNQNLQLRAPTTIGFTVDEPVAVDAGY